MKLPKYTRTKTLVSGLDFESDLDELITMLQGFKKAYPDYLKLFISDEGGWDEKYYELKGIRPENDKERKARLLQSKKRKEEAEKRKKRQEEKELEEYKRLKEKFDDK